MLFKRSAELDELASSSSLAALIAAKARDQAYGTLARNARLRPDADLLARIGGRPAAPVDRRLWDGATQPRVESSRRD